MTVKSYKLLIKHSYKSHKWHWDIDLGKKPLICMHSSVVVLSHIKMKEKKHKQRITLHKIDVNMDRAVKCFH